MPELRVHGDNKDQDVLEFRLRKDEDGDIRWEVYDRKHDDWISFLYASDGGDGVIVYPMGNPQLERLGFSVDGAYEIIVE